VGNFTQLVVARVAAAVGESGCLPPTYSLVGDYFPHPGERTRAMTVYWLAAPVSALVSFIAGGWLNARYGWRLTFFLMGIPGLLAAVLVRTTITEPRKSVSRAPRVTPMRDVLNALWNQPSSRHLAIALILLFMMGFGLAPWYAAFMIRSHHLATAELGVWLGLIFGGGGLIGVLSGGYVVGRWFVNRERDQLRFSAIAIALLLPCFAFFLLLPDKYGALGALVPLIVAMNVFFAPVFALMQRLVTDEMRATALAVVMLLSNLIGMGLGPQVVGILSDALRPSLGEESLRYAMLIMSFTALWSAYHFWRAARTVAEDLAVVARLQGSDQLVGAAA
jgi:predicted MFS family arabinose efflux permease